MNIGKLNVRISILQNVVVSDAIGNRVNSWQPYYFCYATVSSEGGKEMTEAGMVVDDSTADFTVRWCKQTAAVTSTGFRVRFQDDLYDILSVDHMNFRHKSIKLKCRKVRR
ncbi:phage head closure protein [Blautia sp. HCP3S3_H10_1]|uniref:phage head closure protein n=1 Tax=unclassified Blautia TaxID=2648079 RepID=UPI003F9129EF